MYMNLHGPVWAKDRQKKKNVLEIAKLRPNIWATKKIGVEPTITLRSSYCQPDASCICPKNSVSDREDNTRFFPHQPLLAYSFSSQRLVWHGNLSFSMWYSKTNYLWMHTTEERTSHAIPKGSQTLPLPYMLSFKLCLIATRKKKSSYKSHLLTTKGKDLQDNNIDSPVNI